MEGNSKEVAVSTTKERVVELVADVRDIIVPVSSEEKIILNFPLSGVTSRTEGNALVLECPGGQCVYLPGAMENGGVITLMDGRVLTADELVDLLQNQAEDPAAGVPQQVAMLSESESERDSQEQRPDSDADSNSDNEEKGAVLSSGSNNYQDDAGSFLHSIDRLGHLDRDFWSNSPEGEPSAFSIHQEGFLRPGPAARPDDNALPPVPPPHEDDPRLMDVSLSTGPQHLDEYMVLESDPDGAFIHMQLNAAPATAVPLVLGISGTAVMGVDYATPAHWLVLMANGSEVAGLIKDLGNGQVSFDIPAGSLVMGFRVPVIANDSIDPDRTFTYTVLKSGGYSVRSGKTGTVTIVDDAHAQDHGWTPPAPGDPAYNDPHQAGPKTAYARIVLTDGVNVHTDAQGQPSRASDIIENSAGDVHYRFQLLNASNGQDYALREANLFTVKLTGAHGLALGTDYDFDFTNIGLIDPAYSYNAATGILTFTLPQGWSGNIDFTGRPHADFAIENAAPRENIAVEITNVTPLAGTEIIIHGPSVATDIIDIPTVSVAVNTPEIFESAGHATLLNEATFTFSLTSAVPQATTINLAWAHLDANLNTADYKYVVNGTTYGPGIALPTSVTIPANATSVTIKIIAYDDQLTEGLERLKVTVEPQDPLLGDQAGDNYHVATGAGGLNNTATLAIIDDTTLGAHDPYHTHAPAWNNPYLDGPTVQVVAVRGMSQTVFRDADGQPRTDFGVLENFNTAQYKVALLNPDGSLYTAKEDIEVTIKIKGFDGITLVQGPPPIAGVDPGKPSSGYAPGDIDPDWDLFLNNMQAMGFTWDAINETWTGLIKANTTGLGFHFLVHADTITNEDGEGFTISVVSVKGNEAKIGQDITNLMYDSPVITITAGAEYVSESDPLGAAFTLHTSAVSNSDDLWVRVGLGGAGDTAEFTRDYGFSSLDPNGTDIRPDPLHPDYILVRIPKGQDSATFRVPLIDDNLTEGNEHLTVSLKPETDGASNHDKYRVAPANNTAGATIVDDTQPWPAGAGANNQEPAWHNAPQSLDGPYVKLILTDSLGTPLATPAAASIMENGGKVYYQVQLVDRVTGNPYTALQDVTVNLKATGLGAAVLNGAGTDYGFTSTGTGYSYNPATGVLSITIPTGQKNRRLHRHSRGRQPRRRQRTG